MSTNVEILGDSAVMFKNPLIRNKFFKSKPAVKELLLPWDKVNKVYPFNPKHMKKIQAGIAEFDAEFSAGVKKSKETKKAPGKRARPPEIYEESDAMDLQEPTFEKSKKRPRDRSFNMDQPKAKRARAVDGGVRPVTKQKRDTILQLDEYNRNRFFADMKIKEIPELVKGNSKNSVKEMKNFIEKHAIKVNPASKSILRIFENKTTILKVSILLALVRTLKLPASKRKLGLDYSHASTVLANEYIRVFNTKGFVKILTSDIYGAISILGVDRLIS